MVHIKQFSHKLWHFVVGQAGHSIQCLCSTEQTQRTNRIMSHNSCCSNDRRRKVLSGNWWTRSLPATYSWFRMGGQSLLYVWEEAEIDVWAYWPCRGHIIKIWQLCKFVQFNLSHLLPFMGTSDRRDDLYVLSFHCVHVEYVYQYSFAVLVFDSVGRSSLFHIVNLFDCVILAIPPGQ